MSFQLYDKDGNECLSVNGYGWCFLLTTALDYGWNPEGTRSCQNNPNWPGHYDTNDMQIMSENDVANMVEALKKALKYGDFEKDDQLFLSRVIQSLQSKGELSIH